MVALLGCHLNHSPHQGIKAHAGIVYMVAVMLDFNPAIARFFFCDRGK